MHKQNLSTTSTPHYIVTPLEKSLKKHVELTGFEDKILEAVKDPDIVLQGHKQEKLALKFYAKTPISPKTLVVVYREDKQIIITAFLTSKADKIIRRRKTLWRKAS